MTTDLIIDNKDGVALVQMNRPDVLNCLSTAVMHDLVGRMMDAAEAERNGLVARVFPNDSMIEEAGKAAATIASYGRTSTIAAREAVNGALETSLHEGLLFERRVFHVLFATEDQKEGMAAFVEKRPVRFNGR